MTHHTGLPTGVVCYLIRSVHPRHLRRVYIGFTSDLARRLAQHNAGRGCKQTKGRQPWVLIMTVTGFANAMAAKQFEWQWQEKGDSALGGIGSTAATAIPRNGPDRKQRLAHILSDQAMFARTPLQITAWPYA